MSIMQETQKIAAVVLFKDLHARKMDVYDVLAAFISDIIIEKGLSKFSTIDMVRYLVEGYGFDSIPQNVIKTAIKRTNLAESKDGVFIVKRDCINNNTYAMKNSLKEEIDKNDSIINGACSYIEKQKGKQLSDKDKEAITKAFCAFLLDSKCEEAYIAEVASYIISLEGTAAQKRIEEITEGVYQYAALTYNEDISKIENLKNEMTIFLDTETLLSFGGFHGKVYKQYIDELLQLVSEINEKTRKKYISVKYMDYVKKEVDDVFNSAIYYVLGKNYYTRDAAESIAEGCKQEEDVIERRAHFFSCLKAKGISEFAFPERYSDMNNKYNLEGNSDLKVLLSDEITEKDIEKGAKRVSDINKLRKGMQYKNFEEIRYVYVSDNGKVQAVNGYYCKHKNCYNYVMGCGKITNILWLKMNKGLSNVPLPSSLEAITRSRVIISSFTSTKMKTEMQIMNSKIDSGDLERTALYEMLSEFKNYAKRPEDITKDSLDINLHYIESEMKEYGEELSLFKSEAEAERDKRDNITNAFKHYSEMVDKKDQLLISQSEKTAELQHIKRRRKWSNWILYCMTGIGSLLLFIILWRVLVIINKNNYVEWISNREWLFSACFSLIFALIQFITGKRIDKETFVNRFRNSIGDFVYKMLNATSESMDNLSFTLNCINEEISEIEDKMEDYRSHINKYI